MPVGILTAMQVARTDSIGGIPAPIARELMRAYLYEAPTDAVRQWLPTDPRPTSEIVQTLADLGLLQHRHDHEGEAYWSTTIAGNALAQASFRRPITRVTAERNLQAVIERAVQFNADPTHLVDIMELRVFGSYLNPDVDRLGDLDIWIDLRSRLPETLTHEEMMERRIDYARRSGRSCPRFMDAIMWAENEALLYLRQRSAIINITMDDITKFTDRWKVVYVLDEQRVCNLVTCQTKRPVS